MTRSELLEVIYRFYPRGLWPDDPGFADTKEHRRLVDAARRAVAEYPTWTAMFRRLAARYTLQNESLFLLAGGIDPAYSAYVILPGRTLGFHVCFLGPYYGIHRTGAPGEEPAASDIAREIEATYPGYEPIPPELGNEVVPDVAPDPRLLGEATIYECLLAIAWEGSSRPLP
jgi:hypothetical protein